MREAFTFVLVGILASIGFGAYIPTYTSCRNGWLSYEGSCYYFGKLNVEFDSAERSCQRLDSDVIANVTFAENAFIKDRMRDLQHRCFWVGLTGNFTENLWMWYDSSVQTSFTDWNPGSPKNGGDCAVYWPDYNFKWADFPCEMNCAALCKTEGHHEVHNTTTSIINGGHVPIIGR